MLSMLTQIGRRLLMVLQRGRFDADLEEEMRLHQELRAQEQVERGISPEEAHYATRRRFGNKLVLREESCDMLGWNWPETFFQDVRYGLRQLRRNPSFTTVVILILALGIGASMTIFSVVDGVLLRPLPYPNPQRIVTVWEKEATGHLVHLADPNFLDFRAQNRTLSALADFAYGPESVSGGREPVRINIAAVSKDFFKALGVEPFLGRAFLPDEQVVHGAPAMIVSYAYWRQFLGGMDDLSHVQLSMDGTVYPVIGVMPAGFDFPAQVSAWLPRERYGWSASRTSHNGEGIARLRAAATIQQARADLDTIDRRIHAEYGKGKVSGYFLTGATVIPLMDTLVANVRPALLALLGAVLVLFLIACANAGGLLLARASARRKELAVRAALGAGRGRLVRQLLAESGVLAIGSGVLGVVMALCATNLLPMMLPADLPRRQAVAINGTVLSFTLGLTVIVAIGLGIFAAWRADSVDVNDALSTGSRTYTGGSQKARSALVVGEIAATLMLLVGAGLLGRSFLRLVSVSPGFSGRNLVVMKFSLPATESAWSLRRSQAEVARETQFVDEAVDRIRAVPGVEAAGVTGGLPIADPDGFPDGLFLILNGQPAPTDFQQWGHLALNRKQTGEADYSVASGGYFRTVGIPLIRGRLFSAQDGPEEPNVAVISQSLAHEKWPHQNPVGQVVDFGNMDANLKPLTIVGVVGDVRAEGLDQPPSPIIYVDYRQRGLGANSSPAIIMRCALPASVIVPSVRAIFHQLDPNIPVEFSTFAQALGGWMAERRFLLLLAAAFASSALALAAVGVYGLIAYSVAQHTQEIGIRMALGAQKADVLRMVIGQGLRFAITGVVAGIAGALALTRFLSSLLYDVKPTDPLTFTAVSLTLAGMALLACYIPARRAAKVDPMVALRYE
jgi:putative ABC transport system permease protein